MRRVYVMGLSMILIAGSISGMVVYANNQKTVVKDFELAGQEVETFKKIEEAIGVKNLSNDLVVPIAKVPMDKFVTCMTSVESKLPVRTEICRLGENSSPKKMVLVGDSHANQYTETFDTIAKKYGYELIVYTKPGCPFQDAKLNYGETKNDYKECYTWRNQALAEIEKINPDVIIPVQIEYPSSSLELWKNYLTKLKSFSKKIVSISDSPNPLSDIPECLIKNQNNIQSCNIVKPKEPTRNKKLEAESKVLDDLQVKRVDVNNWFCFEQICPAVIDNIVVYHDNSHVSSSYAKYITNLMDKKLESILK